MVSTDVIVEASATLIVGIAFLVTLRESQKLLASGRFLNGVVVTLILLILASFFAVVEDLIPAWLHLPKLLTWVFFLGGLVVLAFLVCSLVKSQDRQAGSHAIGHDPRSAPATAGRESEEREIVDGDLRVVHDAQLKKMLAYIASAITAFAAQLALFNFLHTGTMPPLMVQGVGVMSIMLYAAQVFLILAVVTKFEELVGLETKLGIASQYDPLHKSVSARFWAWLFRKLLFRKVDDVSSGKMRSWILDAGVLVVIFLVTAPFLFVIGSVWTLPTVGTSLVRPGLWCFWAIFAVAWLFMAIRDFRFWQGLKKWEIYQVINRPEEYHTAEGSKLLEGKEAEEAEKRRPEKFFLRIAQENFYTSVTASMLSATAAILEIILTYAAS